MNIDLVTSSSTSAYVELKAEIEQFLFLEARYIDEQRWEDWLELYLDSAIYWVPTNRHQVDPLEQASIIYEQKSGLELRVMRRKHPQAHSIDRMPESTHLISNITLDQIDDATGSILRGDRFWKRGPASRTRHVVPRLRHGARLPARRLQRGSPDRPARDGRGTERAIGVSIHGVRMS